MAKITCTEHRRLPHDANGSIAPLLGVPLVVQTLTGPDATSRLTVAPNDDTRILRIASDVALHVGYGGTATAADDYYPAGAEIIRYIGKGQRLSYIAA